MKTGCIIQARMTSTRLPGKVLKVLDFERGTTILDEVIDRVVLANGVDQVIVATTINDDDDAIEQVAHAKGVGSFRGSETDVLGRYYHAAKDNCLDRILRITSDCPFTDPLVLEGVIALSDAGGFDYVSNAITRTFPHGLDCELFSFEVLEHAYLKTDLSPKNLFFREHVTPFIYGNPTLFRLGNYSMPGGEDWSQLRITVDTKEDYLLACVLRSYLYDGYSYEDIIRVFKDKPFLEEINATSMQKRVYSSLAEEIETAISVLDLQELYRATAILREHLSTL